MLARMTFPGDPQDDGSSPQPEPLVDVDLFDDAFDEEIVAAYAALERQARERLRATVGDLTDSAPAGLGAAAAGARESAERGEWPLDWVVRAAGGTLPDGDADLLLTLLEAVVAPSEPTGLDEEEALLFTIEPDDWVDVAIALDAAGPGAPAGPDALANHVEAVSDDDREVLATGFSVVEPVLTACGVTDLDGRLTPLGAWLLPRAVDRALDPS